MRTVVLASTSPYRKELLSQLQLLFVTAAPVFEEKIDQNVEPGLLVKHLALGKAESLRKFYPDALIIGSDQVFVDQRNRILGKPKTVEGAVEQLRSMAGKSHTFYTGLALLDTRTGEALTDVVTFTVTLRELSPEEIRSYVERERPLDCAGSFKIEGLGIALMESMEGSDYTSLIGLPLIRLTDFLRRSGVRVL